MEVCVAKTGDGQRVDELADIDYVRIGAAGQRTRHGDKGEHGHDAQDERRVP